MSAFLFAYPLFPGFHVSFHVRAYRREKPTTSVFFSYELMNEYRRKESAVVFRRSAASNQLIITAENCRHVT